MQYATVQMMSPSGKARFEHTLEIHESMRRRQNSVAHCDGLIGLMTIICANKVL